MTQPDTTQLHQFLVDHFSLDELKTLCLNLKVRYDDLGGEGLTGKARELVLYMERHGRTVDLRAVLAQLRSDTYHSAFGATAAEQTVTATPPRRGRRPVSTTPPNRRIHDKTGIELIRIPAGPFLYGSADSDSMALKNEKPQRSIDLPEYWIARTPVTNNQFLRFVQETDYRTLAETSKRGLDWQHPSRSSPSLVGKDEHPIIYVSWDDANAFCNWAGLRLPTEEQWEKAARGTDGRIWPWGNDIPTDNHCNFGRIDGGVTPVGKYSPLGDSPYGCADMSGNVRELTASWYNPGTSRPVRGGAWEDQAQHTRVTYRLGSCPDYGDPNVGFRVVELLSDSGS